MLSVRPALAVLFAYAVAVIALTWPLGPLAATRLANTAFSCPFDPLLLGWTLSHESHTLLTAPTELLHGGIFHPAPYAWLYGETGLGALPYFLPTFRLSGNPTLALNLTWLGSIVLTAWALHLVVLRWTGSHVAGAVAASTLLTTRWVLWSHVPCVPTYALLQYFPFIILLCADGISGRRDTLLLALLVLLQGLANAYLAVVVVASVTAVHLVRCRQAQHRPAAVRTLGTVAATTLILLLVYSGHLLLRQANPDLMAQTWWGMRLEQRLPFGPLSYMTPLGVPMVVLALVAIGSVSAARTAHAEAQRRRWRTLWLWTLVGVLLSFSPHAWIGDVRFTMPHLALPLWLGFYDVIRIPDRLGAGALIGLCLMMGLAVSELSTWLSARLNIGGRSRHLLATLAIILMLAEYKLGASGSAMASIRGQGFRVRYPGADAPFDPPPASFYLHPLPGRYPIQPAIDGSGNLLTALRGATGPVLEVPVGDDAGGKPAWQARAEYRSIFHQRPVVNGYSGYYPHDFPARMELARALPDVGALAELRAQTGVTAIIVHLNDLPPLDRQPWLIAQTNRPDLRLVGRFDDDILFTVIAPENPQ